MKTNQIIEAAYAARAEYTHDMARSFAKRIACLFARKPAVNNLQRRTLHPAVWYSRPVYSHDFRAGLFRLPLYRKKDSYENVLYQRPVQ